MTGAHSIIDLTGETDQEDAIFRPQPQSQSTKVVYQDDFIKTNSLTPPQEIAQLEVDNQIRSQLEHNGTFASTLVVSPSLPLKRKSSEFEESERQQHPIRPISPAPRTPSDRDQSVSVVVPSPSISLTKYAKVKSRLNGLSEKYFPTESVEIAEAYGRRYPNKRATSRKFVSLSADTGNRRSRHHTTEDLESIQRTSLKHSLNRLRANGPEVTFNIDRNKLYMLASCNFGFIQDYILRDGVERAPEEFNAGCDCSGGVCEPEGCTCLAFEDGEDSEERIVPYQLGKRALRPEFLKRQSMIFECSHRCGCAGNCWFNVVQRGRTFPVEIFHTGNRGFGLRSPHDIKIGEYLDCYLGEVLTKEESDEREDDQKISYLFGLDFLLGFNNVEMKEITEDDIYVVDGRKFGNVTRFMNHSCSPNCKIVPVSKDHGEYKLYYLAFFASRDIPAGEELTFDYNPGFDKKQKKSSGAVECLCGAKECRGQLWPNSRKQQQVNEASFAESPESSDSDE